MDSEGQISVTLSPHFELFTPYRNLLGDLQFAVSLLLFSGLFSFMFVIVLISYHMQIYPAV
jgi:hypothetical protein